MYDSGILLLTFTNDCYMYLPADWCIMTHEDEQGLYWVKYNDTDVNILNDNYDFDAAESGIKVWNT